MHAQTNEQLKGQYMHIKKKAVWYFAIALLMGKVLLKEWDQLK